MDEKAIIIVLQLCDLMLGRIIPFCVEVGLIYPLLNDCEYTVYQLEIFEHKQLDDCEYAVLWFTCRHPLLRVLARAMDLKRILVH